MHICFTAQIFLAVCKSRNLYTWLSTLGGALSLPFATSMALIRAAAAAAASKAPAGAVLPSLRLSTGFETALSTATYREGFNALDLCEATRHLCEQHVARLSDRACPFVCCFFFWQTRVACASPFPIHPSKQPDENNLHAQYAKHIFMTVWAFPCKTKFLPQTGSTELQSNYLRIAR